MHDRPPLVMIPALLWDEGLYGRQVEELGDIVRPIPLVIAEQNWNAAAEAVLERAPPGRFLLAGTSFGGSLALEVAARAPDRVAGLWLSGCHAGPSRARAENHRMIERASSGEEGFRGIVDDLVAESVHPGGPHATAVTASFRASAHRLGAPVFCRQMAALTERPGRERDIARLSCPIMLLWGREDPIAPLEAARTIQNHAAPDAAELFVIDDCGHLPTVEQPDETTALTRQWLLKVLRA